MNGLMLKSGVDRHIARLWATEGLAYSPTSTGQCIDDGGSCEGGLQGTAGDSKLAG